MPPRSSATPTTSRSTSTTREGEADPADAGFTLPVPLEFWYPTDVSRPYMPDPKRNFEAFAASLNRSGFKVTPKSAPWNPDYLGRADAGNAGNLRLLGWTGDYGDADNFIGTFFQSPQKAWGTTTKPLTDDREAPGRR